MFWSSYLDLTVIKRVRVQLLKGVDRKERLLRRGCGIHEGRLWSGDCHRAVACPMIIVFVGNGLPSWQSMRRIYHLTSFRILSLL